MVNIIDIKKEQVEEVLKKHNTKDTFDLFLKIGKEYTEKYKSSVIDIHTKEGQKELRRLAWYVNEELCEMINCLKIREWSKTEYPADIDHFYEELIDFFNFVMSIIIVLGFDKEKFKQLYIKKYLVNKFRLETRY